MLFSHAPGVSAHCVTILDYYELCCKKAAPMSILGDRPLLTKALAREGRRKPFLLFAGERRGERRPGPHVAGAPAQ